MRLAGATLAIVASLLALPSAAAATVTSTVTGNELVVTNNGGGLITIACAGGNVKINGADPAPAATACLALAKIEVKDLFRNADTFDLTAVGAADFSALNTVVLNGGDNADTILGSQIADTIKGGGTEDRLVGGGGADVVSGEGGNDTFVWKPGEGNDVINGDAENDTVEVNGDTTGEQFAVRSGATAGRIDFERNGASRLDIGATEKLDLNANDGDDTLTVTSGPADATELSTLSIDADGGPGADVLAGGPGKDVLAGGPDLDAVSGGAGLDSLVWNAGDGSDTIDGGAGKDSVEVNGGGAGEQFTLAPAGARVVLAGTGTPAPFDLDIGGAETLDLSAGGGDDSLNAGGPVTGLTGLEIAADGGTGADVLNGGDGFDVLAGGPDDDRLAGGSNLAMNFDRITGEEGDDTLVWNSGDGRDSIDGGAGDDSVEVNGAQTGEQFAVQASGIAGRFDLAYMGLIELNFGSTETLDVKAGGGNDSLNAGAGTNLTGLAIEAEGGPGADDLNGAKASDILSGGEGEDHLAGGAGQDLLDGGAGNDNLLGDQGEDLVLGSTGNDSVTWNEGDGNDEVVGEAGVDLLKVNGSPTAGDELTLVPGQVTKVERTNLEPFTIRLPDGNNGEFEEVLANTGGGDDSLNAGGPVAGMAGLTIAAEGGPGADVLNGGDATDFLFGGAGDDTLDSGGGNDFLFGEENDDTLVWNPGDGSDTMDGGSGNDSVEVNGGEAGEQFTLAPVGARVALDRTGAPGPFNLNIGTSEQLHLDAGGGGDSVNAGAQAGLAGLIDLDLDGGAGADLIVGGDGADLLGGGAGNDQITSRDAALDTVNCGTEIDTVTADATDSVSADCEAVDRGQNTPPPPPHPTATSLSCAPAALQLGAGTSCVATVAETGANPSTPTGRVKFATDQPGTFSADGSCNLTPLGAERASCAITYSPGSLGSGTHKITASYGADATHRESSGSTLLQIGASENPVKAPNTTFAKKPRQRTTRVKAEFRFVSDQPGSSFQCKLDRKPFRACHSPFKVVARTGRHVFKVRAINAQGLVDATPAVSRWRIG